MILLDSDLVLSKVRDAISDGLATTGLYVVGIDPGDDLILARSPLPLSDAPEEIKAAAEGLVDTVSDVLRIAGGMVPYAVVMAAPDLDDAARTASLDEVLDNLGDEGEFPSPIIALHTADPRVGGQMFHRTGQPEIVAADAIAAQGLISGLSPTPDHLAPITPIIDAEGIEPLSQDEGHSVQDVCDTLLGLVLGIPPVGDVVLGTEEVEYLIALMKCPLASPLVAVFAARPLLVPGLVSMLTHLARRTAGPVAASAAGYAMLPQITEDTSSDDEGLSDLLDLAVRSGGGTAPAPLRMAYRALTDDAIREVTVKSFRQSGKSAERGLQAAGIDPFRSV